MAEITAQMVKELRTRTSAGMMDCKKALNESSGDMEQAVELLRKKGLKDAGKRADRDASEGVIHSYLHGGGKIGVMVELNCETDFVARNEEFQGLAQAIAMHVAWANPPFLNREEVPSEAIEKKKEVFRAQLKPEQEKFADKILEGKLDKFYAENCLLEQLDARDPAVKKSIGDLITDATAKMGEKIQLRRFVRFELGGA